MKKESHTISHIGRAILSGVLILASAGAVTLSLADVPVKPTNIVDCSCVTSNSQTCATSYYESFLYGDTLSSCGSDNNYSVNDKADKIGPWYDPVAIGNSFLAIGKNIQECSLFSESGIQSCTSSIADFNGAPLFPLFLTRNIGDDTSIKCLRSGGFIGTLRLTGSYLTYFSIGAIGGGGAGGSGEGNGSDGWIPMAHNFSCY